MKHTSRFPGRRLLALTLTLTLLAGLTGCFQKEKTDESLEPEPSASSTAAPAPEVPETSPEDTTPVTSEPVPEETAEATQPTLEPGTKTVSGTINVEMLNIRLDPSIEADRVGTYLKGDRVEIIEVFDGWARTHRGWIMLEYVTVDELSDSNTDPFGTDEPEQPTQQQTPAELESNGSNTRLGSGVVTLTKLNVRSGPGTDYPVIGSISKCTRLSCYEKVRTWVRVDAGWISTKYFYIEGTTGEGAGTGTVTGSDLTIRSGPGKSFKALGVYSQGQTVKLLAQVEGWGYTEKGWISMKYVTLVQRSTGIGTVTASELNIRRSPSRDAEKVGAYAKGTQVEILEISGDWGRTARGWINLDYVQMGTTQSASSNATVTATVLNIRSEPSTEAQRVGGYTQGQRIEILETRDGWGRTDLGWVSLEFVDMDR